MRQCGSVIQNKYETYRGAETVKLDALEGIRDKKSMKDSVSFLYSGDMNRLLQVLSAGQISDLSITEPDLEEIFMHYYTKAGDIL